MFACQSFQEFSNRTSFAALGLLQTAADGSHAVKKLLVFKQSLVGISTLTNHFCLAASVSLEIASSVDVREVNGHAINLQ